MMAKKHTSIHMTRSDMTFHVINYIFLTFSFLIILIPILNIVSNSISDPGEVALGRVGILPIRPTLAVYKYVITDRQLLTGYGNSLFYTLFGTILSVVLTILAAYPLSKKDLYGKGVLTGIFFFTMLFGGGMIPTYLVVKNLGMLNTRWAMIFPGALSIWNLFMTRTFFQSSIPEGLCEAANIDGADDFKIIFRIVLPISKPIIAVMVLFYAVGQWNAYFSGLMYLTSQNLLPLQVVLRNILTSAQTLQEMQGTTTQDQSAQIQMVEAMKYAIIVFASVPVLVLYPFVQKYFTQGIMIGSIKG